MADSRRSLRLLLLQIRDEAQVRREEHASFAAYAGVESSQIEVLNVFDHPAFPASAADGYDGLLVGGASEASVLEPERYAFLEPAKALLLACAQARLPVFASCFGFQLATLAFGGEIVRDEKDFEMGTISISLTPESRSDPLFRDTPDGFRAVAVHRERAPCPPPGAVSLAYTEQCCHAFALPDRPFWAFQFHPEVDRAVLVERLTFFKDHYTESDAHLDAVLAEAEETPESNHLVRKFVERVLVGGERFRE